MNRLKLKSHVAVKFTLVLLFSLSLSACGGGGGESGVVVSDTQSTASTTSTSDSSSGSGVSTETLPVFADVPMMKEFTARMLKYGKIWGDYLKSETDASQRVYHAYYDGARTFYQIAEFTGQNEPWHTYARKARDVIVNDYLIPNNYKPAGWWIFPHGMEMDWRVGGNANSLTDMLTMKGLLPRAGLEPKTDRWWEQMYSRPVAYTLETHMQAERAGISRDTSVVNTLVDMALGHIRQWTTGVYLDAPGEKQHVQAFMTGLTTSALIDYYERSIELGSPDERIPVAIKTMADWLWSNMWVADVGGTGGAWTDQGGTGYGTFRFRKAAVNGSPGPAPMVAQLIVPMYAFLYKHNCNATYRSKADLIFAGGVGLVTHFAKGKFFNQQHRSVFKYFKWRAEGDNASCN